MQPKQPGFLFIARVGILRVLLTVIHVRNAFANDVEYVIDEKKPHWTHGHNL